MTAASSPKDHNAEGRDVVVCMELQPSTFYLDEDSITFYVEKPFKGANDVSSYVLATWLALTLPNNSGWKKFAEKERASYIESAVRQLRYTYHHSFEAEGGKGMHSEMEKRIRELLPGVWMAAVGRLAAHHAKKEGDWSKWDAQKAYMEVFPGSEWEKIPPKETLFPTVEQGEAIFMRENEKLTRAMRFYARPGSKRTDRETARVMDPIGYAGSNRITAVVEMLDGRKYRGDDWKKPTRLVIHYGTIPHDFFAQYKERYGGEFLVDRAQVVGQPFSHPDLDEWWEKTQVPASQKRKPEQHPLVKPWMNEEEKAQVGKASSSKLAFPPDRTISLQEARDRKLFGPVWHGTTSEARETIDQEGFKVFEGEARTEGISHGYEGTSDYALGLPAPVHHLGYATYLTTVKAIAKMFNGGTERGLRAYYLDVPRLETINFASPVKMMKWWLANGYPPDLAKVDRVAATKVMTDSLKSRFDAVWFKGRGIRRLLDGDQVAVFNPSRIYLVDPSLARPGDVGSKVVRKADGMRGTLMAVRPIPPDIGKQYHGGATRFLDIKWQRGGRDYNTYDREVEFVRPGA